jgi:DNA modification methylase
MKPVELVENAMLNNSDTCDVVYDGYLGSGTTIIAGQNLGRKVRAVEIAPGYAAVTLQRFFDHTGLTPKRIA